MGGEGSRLLTCNPMLKAQGFYKICGRMIGHMFLYSEHQIYGVSPVIRDMLLGRQPCPDLKDLRGFDSALADQCEQVGCAF